MIDPITAYLGDADSHKHAEIRGLLAPLADLAAKHGAAIVCVSHLNKCGGGEAMMRITGSLAFVAASRAAFLVAKDKDDDNRRLFLPLKNNIGHDRSGLAYELRAASIDSPAGMIESCHVVWHSEAVTMTADEVLRQDNDTRQTASDEAGEWLQAVLADGPVGAKQLQAMTRDAGIAWRTVRRAKEDLGIKSAKSRFDGGWEWSLPSKMAKVPEGVQENNLDTFGEVGRLRDPGEAAKMSKKPEDGQANKMDTFDGHGHLGDNSSECLRI